MNRQQQRAQERQQIDLRTITYPWQMTDMECETMLENRLRMNLLQTGIRFTT